MRVVNRLAGVTMALGCMGLVAVSGCAQNCCQWGAAAPIKTFAEPPPAEVGVRGKPLPNEDRWAFSSKAREIENHLAPQ
jgi:hypothetical protein